MGEVFLGSEQFFEIFKENYSNYRILLEKEKEWVLVVFSFQFNIIVTGNYYYFYFYYLVVGGVLGVVAGSGGDLVGFRYYEKNGGVVLFFFGGGCGGGSMLLDRDRLQLVFCIVGFVDCFYGIVFKLKELYVYFFGM